MEVEMKEIILKMVGTWYSTQTMDVLTFDFIDNIHNYADLKIQKGTGEINKYQFGLIMFGYDKSSPPKMKYQFELKGIELITFKIEEVTKDELVLIVLQNMQETKKTLTYIRKNTGHSSHSENLHALQ